MRVLPPAWPAAGQGAVGARRCAGPVVPPRAALPAVRARGLNTGSFPAVQRVHAAVQVVIEESTHVWSRQHSVTAPGALLLAPGALQWHPHKSPLGTVCLPCCMCGTGSWQQVAHWGKTFVTCDTQAATAHT